MQPKRGQDVGAVHNPRDMEDINVHLRLTEWIFASDNKSLLLHLNLQNKCNVHLRRAFTPDKRIVGLVIVLAFPRNEKNPLGSQLHPDKMNHKI